MAPPSASILRVAAVPMFNIDGVGDSCAFITEKIEAAGRADADVVVFPETATNAYHTQPLEDREAIEAQLPEILRTIGRTGKPHQLNQSCIIDPEPRYLARAGRDGCDGMLLADLDPQRAKAPMNPDRYTIGEPWVEMLDYYRKNGFIDWMK